VYFQSDLRCFRSIFLLLFHIVNNRQGRARSFEAYLTQGTIILVIQLVSSQKYTNISLNKFPNHPLLFQTFKFPKKKKKIIKTNTHTHSKGDFSNTILSFLSSRKANCIMPGHQRPFSNRAFDKTNPN